MESSLRVANIRDYRREPSRAQVACSRCALGELCLPRGLTADETERFEQIVHRSALVSGWRRIPFRRLGSHRLLQELCD